MTSSARRFGFGLITPLCVLLSGCGASLTGGHDAGHDRALACAASGTSCGASGCCLEPFETCLAQGSDKLCVNAIPPPPDGSGCDKPSLSNLPGAALVFPDQPCSYTLAQLAAGIQIPYQEQIAQALAGLHPSQADAGRCDQPDDSGLIVSFKISGGDQSYCRCDTGFCAPQSFTSAAVVGTHDRQIAWDGRNWYGPSDTNNGEGAPFPPGTYTLELTSTGTRDISSDASTADAGTTTFSLTATRTITITP